MLSMKRLEGPPRVTNTVAPLGGVDLRTIQATDVVFVAVLQVFRSLLKGHALEARHVVRQALDILTLALPLRMENGRTMLTHWTKKITVEEEKPLKYGPSVETLTDLIQALYAEFSINYINIEMNPEI
ncbi:hypothetical protein GQX74_009656 [Glossina fuscipes]|nr:hypothetical protein GQX74_009656 [Glossina fuscipes]